MAECSSFDWSILISPVVTFGAALLAFLLGQATYRRQKEQEIVRSRYLEGGIDRFASNIEYALGAVRHNYARTLQILKLFRDVNVNEAADLASRSSFRLIEPEKIDLEAGYRVEVLTRNALYGRAQGLLFALANASENFFVNDAGALIRLIANGEISVTDQAGILDTTLAEARKYQAQTARFYTLFYRLQDIGRILERKHINFREVDNFFKNGRVVEIGAELEKLFPPEEDDSDEEP